jgi:hypothetical protein
MRTCGFVLAMVTAMAPSLSYSQTQRASDKPDDVHAATTDPVEAHGDSPASTASERRSLMGMVMDVLIASAEQQSALQKTTRQAAPTQADPSNSTAARITGAVATSATLAKPASSSDLATREQIAVESEP